MSETGGKMERNDSGYCRGVQHIICLFGWSRQNATVNGNVTQDKHSFVWPNGLTFVLGAKSNMSDWSTSEELENRTRKYKNSAFGVTSVVCFLKKCTVTRITTSSTHWYVLDFRKKQIMMPLSTHEWAQNNMFGVMYRQSGACRPSVQLPRTLHSTVISRTNIYRNQNTLF